MSIFFSADNDVLTLVKRVMNENHPDLVRARVDIGVTFALSSKEEQPALKEHGQPTFGMTKIVAPKDRVRKSIDVELWLDGDEWGSDTPAHRYAKIDHLLQRIEVKKPKPKKPKKGKKAVHGSDEENAQHEEQEFLTDAGGRAILKMRKPDLFVPGGYRDVIERNGNYAPECIILDRARILADAAVKAFKEDEAENERERAAGLQAPKPVAEPEPVAQPVAEPEPVAQPVAETETPKESTVEDLINDLTDNAA